MRTLLGLLALLLVGSPPWTSDAFNVETKHFAVYRRENGTMFGFSVASYRDRVGRGWVIVGAPEAQTSQRFVYKAGATYKCDIAVDDKCDYIQFDPYGNTHLQDKNNSPLGYGEQQDNKTLQWFGATVSASQVDGGPIMACAPRYVWLNNVYMKDEQTGQKKLVDSNYKIEPVGTCYVARKNFLDLQEYAPCRTRKGGYHQQGWCQAGLGGAVSKRGERVFIGAPGAWYWQGQFFSIDSDLTYENFIAPTDIYPTIDETTGQVFSQSIADRAKVIATKEGPSSDDDNYMGYSVATGNFEGNGDSGAAVGVPHADDLFGKVILFSSNMKTHRNLSGDQMGAYFGYSLAGGDIDGDGFDDLIVGAPMYTIKNNPEMNYETGRVYIIYQGVGPARYLDRSTLDGEANRGRFGLSVAYLGDINHDGYGDLAVGAPYVNDGEGAVYVFHGSRDGIVEKYSQAIYPKNLGLWELPKTFGFSVSGGLDLDNNGYTDLLVGAYESNAAMFFRSRPVIKMDSYVKFDVKSKLISVEIDKLHQDKLAEGEICTLNDDRTAVCFTLTACLKYTGDGILPRHTFVVQHVLDVKQMKSPRLMFYEYQDKNVINESVPVAVGELWCKSRKVFVNPNIRDKLTSLDAELRISIDERQYVDNGPRNPAMVLRPALGTTTSLKDSLSIRKNCGSDNICIPDLKLIVDPSVDKYLLGSGKRFELDIVVVNNGEDAFEATYNLRLPQGIDYINIQRVNNTDYVVQCSAPKQSNNNTLRCDLGNPLPQGQAVHFKVYLQPVTYASNTYELDMQVNCTNAEDNSTRDDNSYHLSLPLFTETELLVEGESKLKDVYYNPDNYTSTNVTTELQFGPSVIHNYTIRNQGPSEILEAVAYLIWPARTLAEDELLYLVDQPETSGPEIRCATANANYLNLKLEKRRKFYVPPTQSRIYGSTSSGTIQVTTGFGSSGKKEDNPIDVDKDSSRRHQSSSSSSVSKEEFQVGGSRITQTTYRQNFSSSGSSEGGFANDNRRVIVGTETSGSYGGGGTIIGTGQPSIEVHQSSRQQQSGHLESEWGTSAGRIEGGRTITSSGGVRFEETENERRYQEQLRQQTLERQREEESRRIRIEEEERLRIQEETRLAEARQEQERLATIKRKQMEEEERLRLQEEHRLSLQRKHEEEERRRIDEEQRFSLQRKHEQEERRRIEEEQRIALQRRYEEEQQRIILQRQRDEQERLRQQGRQESVTSTTGGQRQFNGGEIQFHLSNATSTQDLKRIFGALSKDAMEYEVYSRQGKQYVQFMGRFRTAADRKEFIEFEDGTKFPLLDRYGAQSYVSESSEPRDGRFLRIEGELSIDSNGRGYIVLKDGRKFALQGTYTYTEERTYTLGGPDGGSQHYGRNWQISSKSGSADKDYENSYSSRSYKENEYEENKGSVRSYGRENGEALGDSLDPNHLNSRFKRESDVISVEAFRKFEKLHRRPRQLAGELSSELEDDESVENSARVLRQTPSCKTAKCLVLRCEIGPLKRNEEVWIGARYLINGRTLNKIAFNEKIRVSTQLVTEQTLMPIIGKPAIPQTKSHEIFTNVEPNVSSSSSDMVPLWVVVLSAVAGTIILLLLIFLLYKCGFFKRNRPSDAPERQPLNRNGHFQQEEH